MATTTTTPADNTTRAGTDDPGVPGLARIRDGRRRGRAVTGLAYDHVDGAARLRPTPVPAVHHRPVDVERATHAMADLLDALGLDRAAPSLAGTPRRVAEMYAELLTPEPFHPTTFPNDAGYDELVLVADIPVTALCEHHLLPFRGVAHVGYLPDDTIVGLSKLARLVEALSRRPQVQERLTTQVADWLRDHLAPRGVGVVVEAEHLCMTIRGVRAAGTRTVTSTLYGELREDPASRQEFLALTSRS